MGKSGCLAQHLTQGFVIVALQRRGQTVLQRFRHLLRLYAGFGPQFELHVLEFNVLSAT